MRILLSGGGTAGHINPAVAIASYAKMQNSSNEVLFIGTKKGLESTLVPSEGYDIKYINVEGLKKEISIKSMVSAVKMGTALARCVAIIKRFKPDIVVGTGGYVCVPALVAAKMLGIPSVVHEQNVFPGSAVKFVSDKCDVTLISFNESIGYLKNAKKLVLTGNPIRPSILTHTQNECKDKLGIKGKKVILCFGGSLGANRINDVMTGYLKLNPPSHDTVVYFGTGKREYERVMKNAGGAFSDNIKVLPYIDNMDILMNAADVVISRSGAITLAEICALGKPCVLIPSPNVTNDHQLYNAKALENNGAAIMIEEKDFDEKSLKKALDTILSSNSTAEKMSHNSKNMGITDATEKIFDVMKGLT